MPEPGGDRVEALLREFAPQVLAAVARWCGDFCDAEDAVQEALVEAATTWPERGEPASPGGWLFRVACRRVIDRQRQQGARRRREELAASWSTVPAAPVPDHDDTLLVLLLCCHPTLSPAAAIPLTLRAVCGLTTREIARAFFVPEATMAQRISRAKARLREVETAVEMPAPQDRAERVRSVRHVLYLLFTEGHGASSGSELTRPDLAAEAIRLTRMLHAAAGDDPEVAGLLALMLLTDARRPARTDPDGALVPLAEQDRTRWDHTRIEEGLDLIAAALEHRRVGEYQLQAAIAAAHARANRYEDTDWAEIASLYALLDRLTDNPMVRLNRAVAVAMAHGPQQGLAMLADVEDRLGDHHRWYAVRAHLLEQAGEVEAAAAAFRAAARLATNTREQHYLTLQAARLAAGSR